MTSTTDRVSSRSPEGVLSVDRACVPHDDSQHRNAETSGQPHDEKIDLSLVELKVEGML
jgi:hypothetical protein